jgi:hypothetical protein
VKHSRSGYVGGCRCEVCTEAHRVYMAEVRERLHERPIPRGSHGTKSTYNDWGCRCRRCTEAHCLYCKEYRESVKAALGMSV